MNMYLGITNDEIFEGTQSFKLLLDSTSSPHVVIGNNDQVMVNISDDEIVNVFFGDNYISATESDGYVVVGVNASLPSGGSEVIFSVGTIVTPGTAQGEEHNVLCIHINICIYSTNCSVNTVRIYSSYIATYVVHIMYLS